MFLKDSKILKSHGNWHVVLYNNRALALVNKSDTMIQTLGSAIPEDEDGRVLDEAILLDWVGDELAKHSKLK
jgi:hypothetical protein